MAAPVAVVFGTVIVPLTSMYPAKFIDLQDVFKTCLEDVFNTSSA